GAWFSACRGRRSESFVRSRRRAAFRTARVTPHARLRLVSDPPFLTNDRPAAREAVSAVVRARLRRAYRRWRTGGLCAPFSRESQTSVMFLRARRTIAIPPEAVVRIRQASARPWHA